MGDEEAGEDYEPLTDGSDNSEDEEDGEVGEDYESLTDDSDSSEDEDDEGEEEGQARLHKASDGEAAGETSKRSDSIAAPAGIVVPDPDGVFLVPVRYAAVKNTAGFMQISAAEAGTGSQEGREILVLYRYTRFKRTWSGRLGVEVCRGTKLHWLRFAVPPTGDMATSLAWVSSSLSPLIYPGLFRRELRDLWSSLAAPAIIDTIPPQTARLQLIVDVGILRRKDHTAERMEHMRGALEATMGEAWPDYYHVGMELQLPEPVRRVDDGGDENGAPPAKRRRINEAEECSLCFDPLESGLAAWPGCGHVFHGECVEQTLAGRETCPLCRHKLSDPRAVDKNIKMHPQSAVCQ